MLSLIVILSEAKNLGIIKWVLPRFFLPTVVRMTIYSVVSIAEVYSPSVSPLRASSNLAFMVGFLYVSLRMVNSSVS